MAHSSPALRRNRRKVLAAVFPTPLATTLQPTPSATPELGYLDPGHSFGVTAGPSKDALRALVPDVVADQVKWDRAWHTATSFLSLHHARFTSQSELDIACSSQEDRPDVHHAINYLQHAPQLQSPSASYEGLEGLSGWFIDEVRRHFIQVIRPMCKPVEQIAEAQDNILAVVDILSKAQELYRRKLVQFVLRPLWATNNPPSDQQTWETGKEAAAKKEIQFLQIYHATVAFSFPQEEWASLLTKFLAPRLRSVLGINPSTSLRNMSSEPMDDDDQMDIVDDESSQASTGQLRISARATILRLFRALESIGLGASKSQRVFADAMNQCITEYVETKFSNDWERSPELFKGSIVLVEWAENDFARLAVEVLHCSDEEATPVGPSTGSGRPNKSIEIQDVKRWRNMSVRRLGRHRIGQLFDIVVDWDDSWSAMDDLKEYITTPATRTHLTTVFSAILRQRLLQPGASTLEILEFYISLIRSFHSLDPRGVLLDRVARQIRRYLRERDDTVKVIVAGLLADPEDYDSNAVQGSPHVLVELAIELDRVADLEQSGDNDGDLDWDDMGWTPDPIDAGPNYQKSTGSDVVGSLISLFDSKDVFVKEFQNTMGERLLKKDFNLQKETRVLELLKLRFGEGALQASEVMLRDIRESAQIDRNVRSTQALSTTTTPGLAHGKPVRDTDATPVPELHAKILSRLFWPDLLEDGFAIPSEITLLQQRYEEGFEKLKQSRKLTWLHALGQVTVELDLEDRVVTEEAQTWQASVIYAFQGESEPRATRTVQELVHQLSMEEPLVRNALTFWVGKRILAEGDADSFYVLEKLSQSTEGGGTSSAAAAAASAEAAAQASLSGIKPAGELLAAKFSIYWQFIVGMLTNGGPMALNQIVMMLKMTVAAGSDFSEDDLRGFLAGKVQEGTLDVVGGRYKIIS